MIGVMAKNLLLLLFALLLRRSECIPFTSQETGHPNLDSAMVGFNPFLANAYQQFDPGFKIRIFQHAGEVFSSKFHTYSLPRKFSNNFTCALQFRSAVLSNFSQYQREKENRFFITRNETGEKKHALNEVNVNEVSSDALEEDTEEKSIREFFLETNGEIVQSKITCITQELIVTPFASPVFTADFSAALQTLQLAARNSDIEYRNEIYRTFVDIYGTHYLKRSEMGAEIIFQKLFTRKEVDDKTKQARQNCIDSLARRSIARGATSVESLIINYSDLSETCDYSTVGRVRDYFNNSGIDSSRVIINGPPPIGTMKQWNTAVKQSPIPIRFELGKISSLFLRNRIEATNGILLYNFLENEYSRYCQVMDGKHCSPEMVSCDANRECPPGSRCNNVSDTSSDGYKCTAALIDIGGVIVTGGWDDSTSISDVKTINTRPLPNLPQDVHLNTLSQVGSSLYTCGGRGGKDIDNCYTLDLLSRSPIWESSPNLPKPMAGQTAVTIGSHIWFTYKNRLYDFSTKEQLFRTYSLPMVVNLYHCAVSNNTHSYIIGVGEGKNEIWVNKYSSRPDEWLLVAYLHLERILQGCLWFQHNVFIAGGLRGSSRITGVELFNTETNAVTVTGPLVHAREGVGMYVLDGEPAVVGGRSAAIKTLDTIETFDLNTETWRVNAHKLLTAKAFFGHVQLS